MKIGEILKKLKSGEHNENSFGLELEIRGLPKKCLDNFFQEKFNKNLDYDQWVGIRETLEGMGNRLYELSLSVIGTAIYQVREEDQEKIHELEHALKQSEAREKSLKDRLEKYEDVEDPK